MSRTIFMTGATGYAGGAILDILFKTQPRLSFTLLVRTQEQGEILSSTYPGINTIVGTLESRDLLIVEAAKADVVLHAANVDHEAGTLALLDGMKSKKSADKGVYVVLSGSACLLDVANLNPGKASPRIWSDLEDAEDIWNLPTDRIHVGIERKVVAKAADVKTVILAPCQIFSNGVGVGVGKKENYINELPRAIIKHGKAFMIGNGENVWAWISIEDLGLAASFVIDEALKGGESQLAYGREGYYFLQTGELTSAEQAELFAEELHEMGAIDAADVVSIIPEKANEMNIYGTFLWGSTMRPKADKLRKLGWKPKTKDWRPLLASIAKKECAKSAPNRAS